ncbi:hypothetical protein EJ110_NYTH20169 [Nymphaea thermarum]|nr:hypothetical protein EJ110_NYTH20169 [Nymphaea thermarum]
MMNTELLEQKPEILLMEYFSIDIDEEGNLSNIYLARLSGKTAAAVNDLLPDHAQNDLASLCLWADHVKFRYASESITAACNFAYKDVDEGSVLEVANLVLADDYFLSRLPTVYLRLAEAGVRLAATLNRALG